MRYPPRLGHLATRAVLLAKLIPLYAAAHQIDDDEARDRLEIALQPKLIEDILAHTWTALLGGTKKLDENGLLEKVSRSLGDRPLRAGRVIEMTPSLSAFMVIVDLAAGTASDAVRHVMESEDGKRRANAGLADAGKFLAAELLR